MAPIAAASPADAERIARLEERSDAMHTLLTEIRADQRAMSETLSRASGGLRVLLALGALAAALGTLRAFGATFGTWLIHNEH